ncbi:hypothetical protein N7G274_003662 [Stereocaulon virgatum]|uniref:Uncharacterized protein n=1 Tax=Stereocaulon virgatum TaxID=373712 RepID=A0ABR4AET0_9LECA
MSDSNAQGEFSSQSGQPVQSGKRADDNPAVERYLAEKDTWRKFLVVSPEQGADRGPSERDRLPIQTDECGKQNDGKSKLS